MEYTVDYFISKFSAIPGDKWCIGKLNIGDTFCALGHCGLTEDSIIENNDESWALTEVLNGETADINDGDDGRYQQATPRDRILAALRDIKKMTNEQNSKRFQIHR